MKPAVATSIQSALNAGGTEEIVQLLEQGADPNARASDGDPILYRMAFRGNERAVKILLERGADPNLSNVHGLTPLLIAALNGHLFVLRLLAECGANPNLRDPLGYTALLTAIKRGNAQMVETLLEVGADPNVQSPDGKTPLQWAESSEDHRIFSAVKKATEQFQKKQMTSEALQLVIQDSLSGLVGLEKLTSCFALDLADFVSGRESVARVFWGPSGTGKTEVAQRLSGMRRENSGLRLPEAEVKYVSGVDGKIEFGRLVDTLPPGSIVFIDEADKMLDPNAMMVSKAEAVRLHNSIVTHFGRKKIYWIFVGTFHSIRGQGKLAYESLQKTLGSELTSRLDFLDWEFPGWTLSNILKAVRENGTKRGLVYDDRALLLLAQYCLKTAGGLRAFDNLDQTLHRKFRQAPSAASHVTETIAEDLLRTLGFSTANIEGFLQHE